MSEEQVAETIETEAPVTETTESTPAVEPNEPAPPAAPKTEPAGYKPIDPKTATPEETQERLDYLYKQIKPTQRENREMRQLLADQSKVIDDLSRNQQAVVTHLTERSFADSEQQLKDQMAAAWQKGDNRAYIDAQANLNRLYTQQEIAKQTPAQQLQQQPQYRNAAELANGAAQAGELSQDEYRTTESWQGERSDAGQLLRPWAYSNDPSYEAALFETRSVMANPRFQDYTYEQKLQEVDRRMGTPKRTTSQQVMGGSLTKAAKNTKIELTPKQREIALKTQYAGKGKSEAEHLEKYRAQVAKYKKS